MAATVVESTSTGIYARIQVANLNRGHIMIPSDKERVVIEIGASDRDTLDEWLPQWNDTFLVTAEPLLDKYARGIARQRNWRGDAFQPLGHHHPNGIILPFAVGPTDAMDSSARTVTFNVGKNAGCSSLLRTMLNSSRLGFCRSVTERRQVPLVSLEKILRWLGPERPIAFIKTDAQGVDLAAIESAGPLLSRVRAFSSEVVSDACAPLYEGQPRCSEVLHRARRLGFEPATPIACSPKFAITPKWKSSAWACELDVLFLAPGVRPDRYVPFHNLGLNGCEELVALPKEVPKKASLQQYIPQQGRALMTGANVFYSHSWVGKSHHAMGEPYVCSSEYFVRSASA